MTAGGLVDVGQQSLLRGINGVRQQCSGAPLTYRVLPSLLVVASPDLLMSH